MEFTKLDYCQYLLSSQVNYTLTNLAEHLDQFSHDTINRYLRGEKLSPRLLFEQVEELLERDRDAYLIFDDTVLEKSFGPERDRAYTLSMVWQRQRRDQGYRGGLVGLRKPKDRALLGNRLPYLRPRQ